MNRFFFFLLSVLCISASAADLSWLRKLDAPGVCGGYTPFLIEQDGSVKTWTNRQLEQSDLPLFGALWLARGNVWQNIKPQVLAIDPAQVTDVATDPFIRTTAIVKGSLSGIYYALLHVGSGYPSPTGFVPAWATSSDGQHFDYQGILSIDGAKPYAWLSGQALLVQEDKPAVLDNSDPLNNRFVAYEDGYGVTLAILYSSDAVSWHLYRDASGNVIDVFPHDQLSTGCAFPSMCRTPFGYHLVCTTGWPNLTVQHFFSNDGVTWLVLETDSVISHGSDGHGSNIYYDPKTGLIHALTSRLAALPARHWTLPATAGMKKQ